MAGSVFWTMSGSVLSPAQAFTTLSIVALVSKPLVMLLMAYPQFKGMLACFDRIQTFLLTQRPTHHPSSLHRPGSKENKSSTNSAQCSQHDHELKVIVGTKEAQTSKEEAIIFQNASISPGVDAEPILQNVDVSLSHGSLNLVLGPVGSGKSTLLKAILGEATVCKGDIQVNYGPSAYCAQTPWLQNLSVRDTIIGQSSFDSEWYKSVLHACLLDLDLSHLPGGDEYRVGNGGANLSGGQKQRLV